MLDFIVGLNFQVFLSNVGIADQIQIQNAGIRLTIQLYL